MKAVTNLINRTLQHPHLAWWTDDYRDTHFGVTEHPVPTTEDGIINVRVRLDTNSAMLSTLINDQHAAFAAVVDCKRTFSNHTEISFWNDLQIKLPADSYKADFTISPHILAVSELHLPVCDEHAEEYHWTRPEGFDLPPGAILATGNAIAYKQSDSDATSVIDLVAIDGLPDDYFEIKLDDNRIKILLSPEHLAQINRARQTNAAHPRNLSLFSTYYQAAIREAIGNLPQYADTQWSITLTRALEQHGLALDPQDPHERALEYAQILLRNPAGRLQTGFYDFDEANQ